MPEFSVYEYLNRVEAASLEIAENQKPIDTTIVLWWGLDGLRLNEDGTMEWISRRKAKPEPNPLIGYMIPKPGLIETCGRYTSLTQCW